VFTLLFVALIATLAVPSAAQSPAAAQNRALYVWDLDEELARPDLLLDLADAAVIRHLYLATSKTVMSSMQTELTELLDDAEEAGITCHAVLSENTWALREKHYRGLERVSEILAYNRSLTGPGRITGIHIDVEVHSLEEFKAAKKLMKTDPEALATIQDLLGQWLDFVEQVTILARAEETPLTVSVIVPQWFMKDGSLYNLTWQGVERNVTDHLLRIADEVVVLAYYYKPLSVAKRAQEEVAAAAAPGTGQVRVAVNVSHKSVPTETLWAGGLSAMETALADIQAWYEGESGYCGTAIHMAESLYLLMD
jgi:hypothetical protein